MKGGIFGNMDDFKHFSPPGIFLNQIRLLKPPYQTLLSHSEEINSILKQKVSLTSII